MTGGVVTLLTDFGAKDPFVGQMKGVILARHRGATLIDLAHGVSPQDVVEGAFWIERSFAWFPPGTVHVCVVDPGVGGARAAVAIHARDHYFVGPDNGLLAGVARGGVVREIDLGAIGVCAPSRTFHGRDVFAPAAAELARGRPFAEIGPERPLTVGAPLPPPRRRADGVAGVVVSVDRFGNVITNIGRELLPPGALEVRAGDAVLPLLGTYADAAPGADLALVSSYETVEIARRDGDAAAALGLARGDEILVRSRDR